MWDGYNPYNTIAGFLNGFTANERAALLATTITVGKSSTDGGGTETCVDKVFPPVLHRGQPLGRPCVRQQAGDLQRQLQPHRYRLGLGRCQLQL